MQALKPFDRGKARTPEQAMEDIRHYSPVDIGAQYADDEVTVLPQAIVIKNIECVDTDGKVFERYDKIMIPLLCNKQASGPVRTVYNGIQQYSIPSAALTCNVLAKLYERKDNPTIKEHLMQYIAEGMHIQNTIILGHHREIIHYPHDKHWPAADTGDEGTEINPGIESIILKYSTSDFEFGTFMRRLTGLRDPNILSEMAQNLGLSWEVKRPTLEYRGVFIGGGRFMSGDIGIIVDANKGVYDSGIAMEFMKIND